MQVSCSHCATIYQFDAAAIPPAGYEAQCTHCRGLFFVRPEAVKQAADELSVTCERCGALYQFAASEIPSAGYKAQCTRCDHVFFVSGSGGARAPGAAPPTPAASAVDPSLDDLPMAENHEFLSAETQARLVQAPLRDALAQMRDAAAVPAAAPSAPRTEEPPTTAATEAADEAAGPEEGQFSGHTSPIVLPTAAELAGTPPSDRTDVFAMPEGAPEVAPPPPAAAATFAAVPTPAEEPAAAPAPPEEPAPPRKKRPNRLPRAKSEPGATPLGAAAAAPPAGPPEAAAVKKTARPTAAVAIDPRTLGPPRSRRTARRMWGVLALVVFWVVLGFWFSQPDIKHELVRQFYAMRQRRNPDVLDAYNRGVVGLLDDSDDSLELANHFFSQAVQLDRLFAEGFAKRAMAHALRGADQLSVAQWAAQLLQKKQAEQADLLRKPKGQSAARLNVLRREMSLHSAQVERYGPSGKQQVAAALAELEAMQRTFGTSTAYLTARAVSLASLRLTVSLPIDSSLPPDKSAAVAELPGDLAQQASAAAQQASALGAPPGDYWLPFATAMVQAASDQRADRQAAVVALQNIVATEPRLLRARWLLGEVYVLQGDFERAKQMAHDLSSAAPFYLKGKFLQEELQRRSSAAAPPAAAEGKRRHHRRSR